jgi:hypothetical protein
MTTTPLRLDRAVHVSSHTFLDNTVTEAPNHIGFSIVCCEGKFYVTDRDYVPVNDFVGLDHSAAYLNAMGHFSLYLRTDAAIRQTANLQRAVAA